MLEVCWIYGAKYQRWWYCTFPKSAAGHPFSPSVHRIFMRTISLSNSYEPHICELSVHTCIRRKMTLPMYCKVLMSYLLGFRTLVWTGCWSVAYRSVLWTSRLLTASSVDLLPRAKKGNAGVLSNICFEIELIPNRCENLIDMFISSTKCVLLLVLQLSFQKITPNFEDGPAGSAGSYLPALLLILSGCFVAFF